MLPPHGERGSTQTQTVDWSCIERVLSQAHRGPDGAHLSSLAPTSPLSRGEVCALVREGRSLQPARGGGLVPLQGLHVGCALCCSGSCRLCPLVSSLPLSSSDNTPAGGREAFCFSPRRCLCPVCAPSWLSVFLDAGERGKTEPLLLVISTAVPLSGLGRFPLGSFGVMPGASRGRSSGCWPLWLAGVFKRGGVGGELWGERDPPLVGNVCSVKWCWLEPSQPPRGRERGLKLHGLLWGWEGRDSKRRRE